MFIKRRTPDILSVMLFMAILFVFIDNAKAPPCVLRTPDMDVYVLYPEATGYKAVFRGVSPQIQSEIERFLGEPLGYGEKGTHCIYLVLKDDKPIGFIHPHSEPGKYGSIEILWAYTLEGKIKDFIIQRSREPKTNELRLNSFRSQFRGRSLTEPFVFPMINEINRDIIVPVKGAEEVSYIIAYSAVKVGAFRKFVFFEIINETRDTEVVDTGNN